MKRDLLMDVDGVCAEFTPALISAVGSDVRFEDMTRWDVFTYFTPEQRELAYDYLSDPVFWRNLPVMEGAQEGVAFLEVTHNIIWVTSPWASCEEWESARRDWLNEHFGMDKKGQPYHPTSDKARIEGDLIIDDKPDNVLSWSKAHPGKPAYLFDAPYNQDIQWPHRISWERILNVKNLGGGQL